MSVRGSVDLTTEGAVQALKALRAGIRDVESQANGISPAQARAMTSLARAANVMVKANKEARSEIQKTERAYLDMDAKIKATASNQRNININRNAKTNASIDNSATVADAKVASVEKLTVDKSGLINAQAEAAAVRALNDTIKSTAAVRLLDAQIATEAGKQKITALKAEQVAARMADEGRQRQQANLGQLRYAMYDVTQTAAIMGVALGAAFIAPIAVAVQWQREFANVQRTFGGAPEMIKPLREAFVGLAQEIPESFSALTKIGTLANQIGIDSGQVVNFTEVVAKFGATSGVSVEESATAFGRLNSLIPDVKNNFTGLADSVLSVGVNSVATEGQILKVATQISSITAAAGFGYEATVGFAGALASVAVPPELARGVTTRVFGTLSRAINEGGARLEQFGAIAGMSGAEFKKGWSEDSSKTFLKFMSGIKAQGGGAEEAIRALGITSVRDVPILLRLANAADSAGTAGGLMAQTFKDAANAAGTMEGQYGIIADSISSKITVLVNNVQALMDAAGSGSFGALGTVLDTASNALKVMVDFTQHPVGAVIAGIVLAVLGLGSAIALLGAVAGKGITSYIAMQQALDSVGVAGFRAALGLRATTAATVESGLAANATGTKVSGLGSILSRVGIIGGVAAAGFMLAPTLKKSWEDFQHGVTGVDGSLEGLTATANGLPKLFGIGVETGHSMIKEFAAMPDAARGFGQAINDLGFVIPFMNDMAGDVGALDNKLVELGNSQGFDKVAGYFNELKKNDPSLTLKDLENTLPQVRGALEAAGISVEMSKDGFITFTQEVNGAKEVLEEIPAAEQEIIDANLAMIESMADYSSSFFNSTQAMADADAKAQAWAEGQAAATESSEDSWEDFIGSYEGGLQDYLDGLAQMVAAQDAMQSNLSTLKVAGLSDGAIAELQKLGPAGAKYAQEMVDQLLSGSRSGLDQLNGLVEAGGSEAAAAFGAAFQKITPGMAGALNGLGATMGYGLVTELTNKLMAGEITFQEVISQYNLDVTADVLAEANGISVAEAQEILDAIADARNAKYNPFVDEFGNARTKTALDETGRQRDVSMKPKVDGSANTFAETGLAYTARTRDSGVNVYVGQDFFTPEINAITAPKTQYVNIVTSTAEAANPNNAFKVPPHTGGIIPQYLAKGGPVGRTTSQRTVGPRGTDTVPAWLTPGEGILRVGAMNAIGPEMFHALNNADRGGFPEIVQGVAGNQFNRSSGHGSNGGSQVVELSPYDRALLEAAGNLYLNIPGVAITKAVNSQNVAASRKGGG